MKCYCRLKSLNLQINVKENKRNYIIYNFKLSIRLRTMQRRKNPSAFIRNTYDILEVRGEIWRQLSVGVRMEQGSSSTIYKSLNLKSSLNISSTKSSHLLFGKQVLFRRGSILFFLPFMMQLNMYGFHKQRHNASENYFQHESFRRGDPLEEIRRKPEKKKKMICVDDDERDGVSEELLLSERKSPLLPQHSEPFIDTPKPKKHQQSLMTLCEEVMQQNQLLREMQPIIRDKVLQAKRMRKQQIQMSATTEKLLRSCIKKVHVGQMVKSVDQLVLQFENHSQLISQMIHE